jgi:Amt family ammonium transporter
MAEAAAASGTGSWTAWNQFLVQLTGMGATIALALAGTWIICIVTEKTVGFRLDPEREIEGLDKSLHGEHGYGLVNSDLA